MRQHEIERHGVEGLCLGRRHHVVAVAHPLHRMAGRAQAFFNRLAQILIVLHQQYAHASSSPGDTSALSGQWGIGFRANEQAGGRPP
ncbi:hypothetical protein D3C87_1725140 [compost metagenome]